MAAPEPPPGLPLKRPHARSLAVYYKDEDDMDIDEIFEFLKWLEEYERVGPDLSSSCPWVGLSRTWHCWHGVNAGTEAAAFVYQRLLAGAVSTSLHAS